jgi:prophage tail gpP-like protein
MSAAVNKKSALAGDPNRISLRINNQDWYGWKSVTITRQVDALSGSASLSLADRWQYDMTPPALAEGMACQLLLGPDQLLNGYIDTLSISYGSGDHTLDVTLRDKSADLVDCSALHSPGHLLNLDLLEIAQTLAQPFAVPVRAETEVGPKFASFKLEPGETAFTALDRALRQRQILAMPDGAGGILLRRIGEVRAGDSLKLGNNLISIQASYSMVDRYSQYVVLGQQPGNNDTFGLNSAAVKAESSDPNVSRYRPLVIRAENQVTPSSAAQRAQWEASVRAARAATLEVGLYGWRQSGGQLWPLGGLVEVEEIPALRISRQELVISKIVYELSLASGSTTRLELKDKDAFAPKPVKLKAQVSAGAADALEAAINKNIENKRQRESQNAG